MKVLVVLHDALGGRGGIAKFNRDLLRGLCTAPESTEIVAMPRVAPIDPVADPHVTLGQITGGQQNADQKTGGQEFGAFSNKLSYKLPVPPGFIRYAVKLWWKLLTHAKFDLLIIGHVNLLPFLHLLKFVPPQKRPKQIGLILHGVEALTPIAWRTTPALLRQLDWFAAVSRWTSEKFQFWAQLDPKKAIILPNAVDITRFSPGEPNQNLAARYNLIGKRVLMGMGRLDSRERYKGFDEVLDALPELLKETPNLVYMIVGDGPEGYNDRFRLQQKAAKLGLHQHVIFTGWIDEATKIDHYRLADVFLLCGWGEGFGIVLIEAMACGIPAIASMLDGSIEAVQPTLNAEQPGAVVTANRPTPKNSAHFAEFGWLANPKILGELTAAIREALAQKRPFVPSGLDYFSEAKI